MKGRALLGSVALDYADLTMTNIWSRRRSRVVWGGRTCIGSSRWTMGIRVWGTPVGVGSVLRTEGAPIFVGFVCGIGSFWELMLFGYG